MSYGLMIYQMQVGQLASLYGCQQEELITEAQNRCNWMIERYKMTFKEEIQIGAPTLIEALRQIVKGEQLNHSYGFAYAYAVKIFCQAYHIRVLNNNAFYPCSYKWIEEVDRVLIEMGINQGFQISNLVFGPLPIKIPRPEDFPSYGYINNAVLHQTAEEFKQAEYQGDNSSMAEVIAGVKKWVCLSTSDPEIETELVGFYH